MTKEEAVAEAKLQIDTALRSLYEAGVNSAPTEGGLFTQEQVDAKIVEAISALPADTTPYSEEEIQALRDQVTAVMADDASDKEQIAASQAKIDQIIQILTLA